MLFLLAGGGALAFAPLAILGAASGALYTLAVIISASHGRGQGMVARAALAYTAGATVGPPLGAALSLVDQQLAMQVGRPEERRSGREGVRKRRSRWSRYY